MKRSESDGTDLKVSNKLLASFLIITFLAPASASELHLFSAKESNVMNGILISNNVTYNVSGIIENTTLEATISGLTVDSVNDGTGGIDSVNDGTGGIDSVNDGTGGIDSVNDGTGGIDSVNDGTGGIDSVNDGTGGIDSVNDSTGGRQVEHQNGILALDFIDCNQASIETTSNTYNLDLSKVNLDNEEFLCN